MFLHENICIFSFAGLQSMMRPSKWPLSGRRPTWGIPVHMRVHVLTLRVCSAMGHQVCCWHDDRDSEHVSCIGTHADLDIADVPPRAGGLPGG